MPFALPDADCIHPLILPDGQPHLGTVFLRNVIDQDNFTVGAYSYASDFDPPPVDGWATRLAPYLFPGAPGAIRIGKFCQIAQGARFISAAANHAAEGLSTFPFQAFDPALRLGYHPDRRDIEVGHDVWIGMDAKILSGARIGTGAIIGAGSVVRGDVPPFAVVIGNPGRVIRMRFAAETITALLDLAWWDWPAAVISAHHDRIVAADIAALAAVAP